jgi:prepilin-type processing-associated H-X9-DG protein
MAEMLGERLGEMRDVLEPAAAGDFHDHAFPILADGLGGNGMLARANEYRSSTFTTRYGTDWERHQGLNTLYLDGHVNFMSREAFAKLVNINLNNLPGSTSSNDNFLSHHPDY